MASLLRVSRVLAGNAGSAVSSRVRAAVLTATPRVAVRHASTSAVASSALRSRTASLGMPATILRRTPTAAAVVAAQRRGGLALSAAPVAATMLLRFARSVTTHSRPMNAPNTPTLPTARVEDYFGVNVFDQRAMRETLSPSECEQFNHLLQNGQSIPLSLADSIARALLKWAQLRGCTHYTHWFQPLTGQSAEKHDTFLDMERDGCTPLSRFRGKELIRSEPDGSSFPSGGLRQTAQARGYTAWDPHSPPFVLQHGNGATLYIPTVFFSWKDAQSLDDKCVLLRSMVALRREALKLFEAMGDKSHTSIHTDSGLEQEFFLIDRDYYMRRPDLMVTGRTVLGAPPPKGQELEDQYYAHKSYRFLDAMHDFEMEMWKLGVPIMTRHREVAPGQYEVAPRFAESNTATDRNLIMMKVLQRVAVQHDMAALLHEKPFRGVNGSGKHNNWSFGTNKIPTVLEPGNTPETNTLFMLFLAACIRAVDVHADLLRWAICGPGNDHRLGANEAPPAIMSVYLGDDVNDAMERFIARNRSPSQVRLDVDLGVPTLPPLNRAATDRNRTSPFAFTGNKFEFRAVGSSQTPSRSNMVLNTILADSLRTLAAEISAQRAKGVTGEEALAAVARNTLTKHKRVVFNGNGYSKEWHEEAAKRGLLNLRTTPDVLQHLNTPKNQQLFESLRVLSRDELASRVAVGHADYQHKLLIECKVLIDMTHNSVIPAAVEFQSALATSVDNTARVLGAESVRSQHGLLTTVATHVNTCIDKVKALEQVMHQAEEKDPNVGARYLLENAIPLMNDIRTSADTLETLLPADKWPLPTYHDMLFHQE